MKNKIINFLIAFFGIGIAMTGLNKLMPKTMKFLSMPEMLPEALNTIKSFVQSGWIWNLIGVTQIIGGLLLVFPRFRAVAALILLPTNVGIFLFHLIQDAPERIGISAVIIIVNILLIYKEWDKYKLLWK